MALIEHQIFLGRCLWANGADALTALIDNRLRSTTPNCDELTGLVDLVKSPGFCFTRRVQRSWCLGRTAQMGELTLSILPAEQRKQLVEQWVAAGGGAVFDPASEADAFLEFIASQLSDPSHALTVCRMEQASYRASEAAMRFTPRDLSLLDDPKAMLSPGTGAALVQFFAEPQRLFSAIAAKEPLPPLSDKCFPVLFAPGLPALFRAAKDEERTLWQKLAGPTAIQLLSRDRHERRLIEELFRIGAVDRTIA